MDEHVYRVIQLVGSSEKSVSDAIFHGKADLERHLILGNLTLDRAAGLDNLKPAHVAPAQLKRRLKLTLSE